MARHRLQEPLPTNLTPRPRTDFQESIEFCHYFALANVWIRIRAHLIAGLNATECDFLPTFDNLAMAAYQQYNYAYVAADITNPPSFEQLSDSQLVHGVRGLILWVNAFAQTFNIICDLHNHHAAEVYCDDELTQLYFCTEVVMKEIAKSFLRSELWQPIDPEFLPFEPNAMVSFRHSLPQLMKPLVQELAYPNPFGDPSNDETRYPQPKSDAIRKPTNYYCRQMVKALKTDSQFVGDFLYGQTHPGKNKHANDPFYKQLKSNFSVPSYRSPYTPDPRVPHELQGKQCAQDLTPSESSSDDKWQPDVTSAKRKASEDPVPVKSIKKPKPGVFTASSSKMTRKPKGHTKIADLDTICEWVSKPLHNTSAIYFAYPTYTDSDLLPSIPWTNNDDQQIHSPSVSERVNRVSNYASPQMSIRPMEMQISPSLVLPASYTSFLATRANYACDKALYAYIRNLRVSLGMSPSPKRTKGALVVDGGASSVYPRNRMNHIFDHTNGMGTMICANNAFLSVVAPIDNNLTPTMERWQDIDTETD
ncbi:hypothetical protein K435DRAFT_866067 [Dendrothele bispora CBS 962.96]|uniref:Uncharacterized protein n=1 Tax=Dendrothele bispora (strain CBS 962.96) TaxID=1314807 RepID=A0A4S8LJ60_DENBC|nr:hypothetical protein K435DRAFT_866067 [Dendrothele bispora CBS 962.96]